MTNAINSARRAAGLRSLALDTQLVGVARNWAGRMDQQNRMYHNPGMKTQIRLRWARIAENVGTYRYGSDVDAAVAKLHQAFMKSSGHRKNILGDHTVVGVGISVSNGTMWVTVNFAKVARGQNSAPVHDAARQSAGLFTGGRRASYVVIGRSDVFADNLAGAALAGAHAPLLLTSGPRSVDRSPVLHPATRAEVDRLLGGRGVVYVLGGEQAVSATAAAELAAGGYTVRRLGGETRTDTAAAIAREAVARRGKPAEVLLARADVWADAISAGGYAAATGAPLVLTDPRSLSPEAAAVIDALPGAEVIALGGPVALSDRVVRGAGATRIAGPDRYATSVAIAEELWGSRPSRVIAVHGTGGSGWAYALSQVSRAGLERSPLIQVTTVVPSVVAKYLKSTGARVTTATDVTTTARTQLSALGR